jgi:hypothetical protein
LSEGDGDQRRHGAPEHGVDGQARDPHTGGRDRGIEEERGDQDGDRRYRKGRQRDSDEAGDQGLSGLPALDQEEAETAGFAVARQRVEGEQEKQQRKDGHDDKGQVETSRTQSHRAFHFIAPEQRDLAAPSADQGGVRLHGFIAAGQGRQRSRRQGRQEGEAHRARGIGRYLFAGLCAFQIRHPFGPVGQKIGGHVGQHAFGMALPGHAIGDGPGDQHGIEGEGGEAGRRAPQGVELAGEVKAQHHRRSCFMARPDSWMARVKPARSQTRRARVSIR